MPVRPPLVDDQGGRNRLDAAQRLRPQLLDLLQADQGKLGQAQLVVLGHLGKVGLYAEIFSQFRRQQVVQPGCLVGSLRTGQHQNLVVHHRAVEERRHAAHEPFFQILPAVLGTLYRMECIGQFADVVRLSVPGIQPVKIQLKRIVVRHEFRLQHIAQVGDPHAAVCFAHACPERVHNVVVHFPEILFAVFTGEVHLILTGNDIPAERPLTAEKILDLRHASQRLPCMILPGGGNFGTEFLRLQVARAEDPCYVAVVTGKGIQRPFRGLVLVYPVAVEQIPHPHDVVVVLMRFVGHPLRFQLLPGSGHRPFQPVVAHPFPDFGNHLSPEGKSVRIEEEFRIVGKSAQAG